VIREYKADLIILKGWFTIEAFIVLQSPAGNFITSETSALTMDLLLIPGDVSIPIDRTPYVYTYLWDCGEFLTYPVPDR
jgi:hypothetical protein